MTTIFRLLTTPVDDKGAHLLEQVQATNHGTLVANVYQTDTTSFHQIYGSPFSYWVTDSIRQRFVVLPPLDPGLSKAETLIAQIAAGPTEKDKKFHVKAFDRFGKLTKKLWPFLPSEARTTIIVSTTESILYSDLDGFLNATRSQLVNQRYPALIAQSLTEHVLPWLKHYQIADARRGPSSGDNARRLRAWWEVRADTLDRFSRWVPYPKGGAPSKYYSEIPLVVSWDESRRTFYEFFGRPGREIERPESVDDFFRPGLTWPLRAPMLAASVMAAGAVFSIRGQALLSTEQYLPGLLGLINSQLFDFFVKLSLGRWAYPEFIVGIIQRAPLAIDSFYASRQYLGDRAMAIFHALRGVGSGDETARCFTIPALAWHVRRNDLETSLSLVHQERTKLQRRIDGLQAEINAKVYEMYGLSVSDISLVLQSLQEQGLAEIIEEDEESETISAPKEKRGEDNIWLVEDLISWCVGCAFGRWDIRFAQKPELLPELSEPFETLPKCSPGMLVGTDELPATTGRIGSEEWLALRAGRKSTSGELLDRPISDDKYPIKLAWNGILADMELANSVEATIRFLWGQDSVETLQRDICQLLGVASLTEYLSTPRLFPASHIDRYSKAGRIAPIYWPLQSKKRRFTVWVYYPRLTPDTLYLAAREYADPKVALETARLEDMTAGRTSVAKRREQEKLVQEVTEFRDTLDAIAKLNLKPDFNDGVLLTIAPLYPLLSSWKATKQAWEELLSGKYPWSSISQQMHAQGLVKS